MTTVDPWEKAAECANAMKNANPQHQAILKQLRNLWIALANQKSFITNAEMATRVDTINRLHVVLTVN